MVRPSPQYPVFSLQDVIERLEPVFEMKSGLDRMYSRDGLAKAMGHRGVTGSSSRIIAALGYYGLIEREDDILRFTDLARLLSSPDAATRQQAKFTAAQQPALFKKLISHFSEQQVPSHLADILEQEYMINPKAKERTARNFTDTMRYAGIMQGGIITLGTSETIYAQENLVKSVAELAQPQYSEVASTSPEGVVVILRIPRGADAKTMERVGRVIASSVE